MNDYYALNFEGFRKIIKKYAKLTKGLSRQNGIEFQTISLSNLMHHSKTNEYKFKLDIVKKKVENKFLVTFYPKNVKQGMSELQNIQKGYMMG
jgi:anionic cell wall polymer biosynthesis LytR-Cps2A-Psr (LCP) family protein